MPVTTACCACGGGSYEFPEFTSTTPACTGLHPTESCPSGTANADLDDSTPCTACEVGTESGQGATECDLCQPGTADLDFDPGTACTNCPPGAYAPAGSSSCPPCAAGTADTDSRPGSECEHCEPGSYSEAGQSRCTVCQTGRQTRSTTSACEDCEAGKVDDDSDTTTLCSPCHTGSYSASNRGTSCTMCQAGQATSDPRVPCEECGPGTVALVGEKQYEYLDTSLTQVAVNSIPGHTTFRLAVQLKQAAQNLYGMFGNLHHPMSVPAAYQVASPAGVNVGGVNPLIYSIDDFADGQFDSWLTVGPTDGSQPLSSVGIDFDRWASNGLHVGTRDSAFGTELEGVSGYTPCSAATLCYSAPPALLWPNTIFVALCAGQVTAPLLFHRGRIQPGHRALDRLRRDDRSTDHPNRSDLECIVQSPRPGLRPPAD